MYGCAFIFAESSPTFLPYIEIIIIRHIPVVKCDPIIPIAWIVDGTNTGQVHSERILLTLFQLSGNGVIKFLIFQVDSVAIFHMNDELCALAVMSPFCDST